MRLDKPEAICVLVVGANPHGKDHLDITEEFRKIQLTLDSPPGLFAIRFEPAVRLYDLRKALLKIKPNYVHFSGHSHETRGLVFQDDAGSSRYVTGEELGPLLKLSQKHLRCVFLNGCSTHEHAEAISSNIRYVIGTSYPLEDESAILFSTEFYAAVAAGKSIPYSFDFACSALNRSEPGFVEPKLFVKPTKRFAKSPPPDPETPATKEVKNNYSPSDADSATEGESSISKLYMHHLVTFLLKSPDMTIFLGPDSTLEGTHAGKPYPRLRELALQILRDQGADGDGAGDFRSKLREILKQWAEGSSFVDVLSDYLAGEPGPAHHHLVALALALFPRCRLLLFLTTGFDDLLRDAFSDLHAGHATGKVHIVSADKKIDDADLQEALNNAGYRVNQGEPVIVKLFGSLGPDSPLLATRARLRGPVRDKLQEWLRRPSIFIGYGFEDSSLVDLFLKTDGRGPAFIVHNGEIPARVLKSRGVYRIPAAFGPFTRALMDAFNVRENEHALVERIDALLSRLDPSTHYRDSDSIAARARKASRGALSGVEERLPRSTADGISQALVPITRIDTQPDISAFFQDSRPLLVVVGDSGSGKSTLFYQIHLAATDFISIFYNVHDLQDKGSLAGTLARDLLCDEHDLEWLLGEIGKILDRDSTRLLIMVDAINESKDREPSTLRFGIENLARRVPRSIKIAYSCRRIYWDTFIANAAPIDTNLYYGSQEFILHKFSQREAEKAFGVFQDLYRFRGSYVSLKAELQERITDPLMLRMLAEGYQGKELPSFAPAVLIFGAYEKRFRREWKDTVVPEFLSGLVAWKVQEAQSGRPSDQFMTYAVHTHPELSTLSRQQEAKKQRGKDPLVLLEDEGILTAVGNESGAYRFAYDRFFEYLLGKALSPLLTQGQHSLFFEHLRQQVQKLAPLHFSFMQALKSEVIRLNIEKPAGPWSLYKAEVLRSLLEDPDPDIASFIKDVLRELMFEGKEDLLPVMAKTYPEASRNRLLMLDVAPDSARTLPLIARGLTGDMPEIARRCCHLLGNFLSDPANRVIVEESLLSEPMSVPVSRGLLYYSAALVGDADRRRTDAVPAICGVWRRAWGMIEDQKAAMSVLTEAFMSVVREEGGRFFDENRWDSVLNYLWLDVTQDIKQLALKMVPFIVDPEMKLTDEVREILLFFGSKIKDWSARRDPSQSTEYDYIFEFTIAQWILVQRVRSHYAEVKRILNDFVATGYSLSIEVALSNMQYCCLYAIRDQTALLRDAYEEMLSWMPGYKQDEESFYWPLFEEDPLSLNECPIDTVAEIALLDEFSSKEAPVPFLEEWITSEDRRDRLFAIMCARKLWRIQPVKILRTLALVADSTDETVRAWLDRILREVYIIQPRLAEDFFWRAKFDAVRIKQIKHHSAVVDPSAVVHPVEPLCKILFLGPRERLERFGKWYVKLLKAPSLESFCEEFVPELLDYVIGRPQ